MFNFRDFIVEGGYNVPVVSISRDKIDLAEDDTRNEINRNLAAELSRQWMNPYGGWVRVRKVLEMYSIFLPKVTFQDELEGEEVIALNQFGDQWGDKVDGTPAASNDIDDEEYFLHYSYELNDEGFYVSTATITDEEGLNDLMVSEDTDITGPEGELDSIQE
jgi:hypothetical protein